LDRTADKGFWRRRIVRRDPSITLVLVLALGVGLTTSYPALASVGTKQVSVTRRGGDPVRDSAATSISSDGRFVAFQSEAGDLVSDDHTIRWPDIFVREVLTGITVRASVDSGGGDPDLGSYDPSISADGRYVAFYSNASNLVSEDENGYVADVFVRDLVAGTTVLASVDTGGGDPNDSSFGPPSISAEGRYVAFQSLASDLVAGDGNGLTDVFVRDLVAGTTVRASVDTGGGDPNDYSFGPSISADGRYVAFSSYASDLVDDDGNGTGDIFVRDLMAETTTRASVDTGGGDSNGASASPFITPDGRYVAFQSFASDLVAGDGNAFSDVFVRDLVAGTTVRASIDTEGGDPNSGSFGPSISGDGRYVAFSSYASDLVDDDGNGTGDIFVRDLMAETTTRASVDTGGGDSNGASSYLPSISADGRSVAFDSIAGDLVPGRGDRGLDVFIARW
jgi:Tol biopolymer transport system component